MKKKIINFVQLYPSWSLFIAALTIRMIYVLYHINLFGIDTTNDAGEYIQFAQYMLNQGLLVTDIQGLQAHAGPGYPVLLALDFWLFGDNSYYFSILIGTVFNALSVVIIYKIGFLLHKNFKLALFTAIWAVLYLHFIRYAPFLNKESLVFLLFPLSTYLVLKILIEANHRDLIFFVIAYSWLIHIDERYFFYLPFFLITLSGFTIKGLKYSLLAFLGVLLLMTPWLYRNYIVFERPVILTERIAKFTDKLIGYKGKTNPYRSFVFKTPYEKQSINGYENFRDSLLAGYDATGYGYQGAKTLKLAIKQGYIPKRFSTTEKIWAEFKELMRPVKLKPNFTGYGFRFHKAWKLSSNLIFGMQYGLILIFSVFGLYKLIKINLKVTLCLLTILILHLIIHLVFGHALQRYRVPIDFTLIIFGISGLYYTFTKLKNEYQTYWATL